MPIGDFTAHFPPFLKNTQTATPKMVTATATPETVGLVVHRYRDMPVEPKKKKASWSIAGTLLVKKWG